MIMPITQSTARIAHPHPQNEPSFFVSTSISSELIGASRATSASCARSISHRTRSSTGGGGGGEAVSAKYSAVV